MKPPSELLTSCQIGLESANLQSFSVGTIPIFAEDIVATKNLTPFQFLVNHNWWVNNSHFFDQPVDDPRYIESLLHGGIHGRNLFADLGSLHVDKPIGEEKKNRDVVRVLKLPLSPQMNHLQNVLFVAKLRRCLRK